MAVRKVEHPSVDDRKAKGVEARDQVALSSHSGWRPAAGRPDPVALLEEQNLPRHPDLLPVRRDRMMVSPFTSYRSPSTAARPRSWRRTSWPRRQFVSAIRSGKLEAVEGV